MAAGDNPSTSATLLRRLWNPDNDEDAWRTFLGRYGPVIHRWCRRLGLQHADADEVGARVLAKLATALRAFTYDPAQRFRVWLKTLTHHAWSDFLAACRQAAKGSGDSGVQELLVAPRVTVITLPRLVLWFLPCAGGVAVDGVALSRPSE